jgi:hypothetical protein
VAYGAYPRKGCATGARIGQVYLDLTQATGGAKFPVCDKDWRSMFEKLAQAVATKAPPSCGYAIPAPPAGKTLDPKLMLVWRQSNKTLITKANNPATCQTGWHYDNSTAPKKIILCPQTCSALAGGKIGIEFGCL